MASTSRSDLEGRAERSALREAAAILDAAAEDPAAAAALDTRLLQDVLAAATRSYAAKVEAGEEIPALQAGGSAMLPTATEVLVAVSALLESAHIEPFELGLWQAARGGGTGAA